MQEALIRIRAALPGPDEFLDDRRLDGWIRSHTGREPAAFNADQRAALRLQCESERLVAIRPADVVELCRAVPSPSWVVQELMAGCLAAGDAPEALVLLRQLRHVVESLPPLPPPPAVPAPAPPPEPPPAETAAAESPAADVPEAAELAAA